MVVNPWNHLGVITLALSSGLALAQNVIDLTKETAWTLRSANGSVHVPAKLPSYSHLDLYAAGVIGDPLYGLNDEVYAWVGHENWTYASGPLPGTVRPGFFERTWLVFEGLDTYCTVKLCDQTLGTTNNSYIQWTFDATEILTKKCSGQPKLTLEFSSTPETNLALSEQYPNGVISFWTGCSAKNTDSCRSWGRKEMSDYGWDWAPVIVPTGPWRGISAVKTTDLVRPVWVSNAAIDIYRQGQQNNIPPDQTKPWIFNASLDFVGNLAPASQLHLNLRDSSGSVVLSKALSGTHQSKETITGSTTIDPAQVQLWWPNGMGTQTLYTAELSIISDYVIPVTTVSKRVGFRTIVWNGQLISSAQIARGVAPGANWHFEINGEEFYVKGSNFVPPDAFWPRVTPDQIQFLFGLAKEAHFNMLRVWSSGTYLDDFIYDIADELGILLWSEFQFTDSPFPDDDAYLITYEKEAYYNVRRLNHHPSIALWVGGNELEQIMLGFFDPTTVTPSNALYTRVFEELLIKCVYANSKSLSYIPSSTYNGFLSLDFNSVRPELPRYRNTSGPNYIYSGTDYYNIDPNAAFDYSAYPIGRFADEFGLISFPSLQSWRNAVPTSQLSPESDAVCHHNRANGGGCTGVDNMLLGVTTWLPRPDLPDTVANFSAWIYSTQVQQADYVSHEIAFYRRGSGMPERQLGSLFWMFADIWVGSTWASVETSGRQKLLYYAAKDLYSPLIIYSYYDQSSNGLDVYVTSDQLRSVSGTYTYEWLDWKGNPLFASKSSGSNLTTKNTTTVSHTSSTSSRSSTKTSNSRTSSPPSYGGHPQPTAVARRDQSNARSDGDGSGRFTVGALNTTRVMHIENLAQTLAAKGLALKDAVLRVSASSDDNKLQHTSFFHPTAISADMLHDPGLKVESVDGSSYKVTATKALAPWVWLDSGDGVGTFSDNGFWLQKGESRTVTWTSWKGAATMTARTLYDGSKR